MLIDMRAIEERAADLVVAELGALRWERCDVGGQQIRDFDVVFARHEEPLEVTTSADALVVQAIARMEGHRRIAASVSRSWMVTLPYTWTDSSGARQTVDRLRSFELLVPFIEHLDRQGQTAFDTTQLSWFPGPYQEVARELHALGILHGGSYVPSDPYEERAVIFALGGGGAYGWDGVTDAVEAAARDPGNQAKLAAQTDAPRRHLFVVFTGASETLEHAALHDVLEGRADRPPRLPVLPEPITTVWAGLTERGIYTTPPDEWHPFGAS